VVFPAAPVTIHYHGTPLTPQAQLRRMAGRNFCVPFPRPESLNICLQIGQMLMFDNGAFSVYTRGETFDVKGYYAWLEPILRPPHWAVVPDAIGGSLEDQYRLLLTWPRETFGYANCAAVFHLHMPMEHLHFLLNAYPKVCLGSSGEFWDVGSHKWRGRMDEIFNYVEKKFTQRPWIHGLRMLGQVDGWPLASADSTNVAQNYKRDTGCAECKAAPIDAQQAAAEWTPREIQQGLFV
jgi:hypothetical protein